MNDNIKDITVVERLRMAAEAGVTLPHYTNTVSPVDFPEQIKAGADIHAGDGGYSEGTQEGYNAFVKGRNQSLGKMRIKELAEQAGWDNHHSQFDTRIEKLAELIVRECVGIADHSNVNGKSIIGERIKQHFGVQE